MKKITILLFSVLAFMIFSCAVNEEIDPNLEFFETGVGWDFKVDTAGDFWTNNQYGIARYSQSENKWIQYSKSTEFDIRSNDPGPLEIDGDNIWIGYGWANDPDGLGVTKWNRTDNTFTHYGADLNTPNMPGGPVWDITKRDDGNIWIGTRFDYASAFFDGTNWTPFNIEGANTYFDCNTIIFKGDYGFFESYRGGLHIYDFNASAWLHTSLGVNAGTESFLDRGFWDGCLLVNSNNDIYLASTNNISQTHSPADGIWHYNGTDWSNISPELYIDTEKVESLVIDNNGDLWAFFDQDKLIRIWNGETWHEWIPSGITISDDYYLKPIYFDGHYMWLSYRVDDIPKYARYKLN